MKQIRLYLDMASKEWFEPYSTVDAEVDTRDVPYLIGSHNIQLRAARLLHQGREFILYTKGSSKLTWRQPFAANLGVLDNSTWTKGVAINFEGVSFTSVAKAFVELIEPQGE